jgi:pimeloyl-ACP methyl ester carboxylesterase
MPFGAHNLPVDAAADLTPPGCAAVINDVLEALSPSGSVLIGNDSGAAYSQIAAAARPDLLNALVLTAGETPFDTFPPAQFSGLKQAAQSEKTLREGMQPLRSPEFRHDRRAFGLLAKRPLEDAASDTYVLPALEDDAVLRDVCKVICSASETYVRAAGDVLMISFDKPVLLAWPAEDPVFSIEHARKYARSLRRSRFAPIDDSYGFTPEDQPEQLANTIERFASDCIPSKG